MRTRFSRQGAVRGRACVATLLTPEARPFPDSQDTGPVPARRGSAGAEASEFQAEAYGRVQLELRIRSQVQYGRYLQERREPGVREEILQAHREPGP